MAKLDGISKIASERTTLSKSPEVVMPVEAPTSNPIVTLKGENYESLFPEPTVSISSPPVWIWWLLLSVAAAAIALLGYYVANGKLNQWLSVPSDSAAVVSSLAPIVTTSGTPVATPSSTPSATAAAVLPSPTAAPVSVRVLNGTTTPGAANSAADSLRQAGIPVSGVGNAVSRNNSTTTIYYQSGKLATAQAVQKALSHYTATLIEDSSQTDGDTALVVLGASH